MPIRRSFQFNNPNNALLNDGIICSLFTDIHVRGTDDTKLSYAIDLNPAGTSFDVLQIGDRISSRTSSLQSLPVYVAGGLHGNAVGITANYLVTIDDYIIIGDTSSSSFSVTLPSVNDFKNKLIFIKNTGFGTIDVNPSGTDLIDLVPILSLSGPSCRLLFANSLFAQKNWESLSFV